MYPPERYTMTQECAMRKSGHERGTWRAWTIRSSKQCVGMILFRMRSIMRMRVIFCRIHMHVHLKQDGRYMPMEMVSASSRWFNIQCIQTLIHNITSKHRWWLWHCIYGWHFWTCHDWTTHHRIAAQDKGREVKEFMVLERGSRCNDLDDVVRLCGRCFDAVECSIGKASHLCVSLCRSTSHFEMGIRYMSAGGCN